MRHLKRPSPAMIVACLSLFVALSGVTYAATGGNFILGQANSAADSSALISGVTTLPTLRVNNTGGRPAAGFIANAGIQPFSVNNSTRIAGLNADLVDGKEAAALAGARAYANVYGGDCSGFPAFCPVQEYKGVAYAVNIGAGDYCVGVNGIPHNAAGSNGFTFTRGADSWSISPNVNVGCVNTEFEVYTYSGSTRQNQFFKILIP